MGRQQQKHQSTETEKENNKPKLHISYNGRRRQGGPENKNIITTERETTTTPSQEVAENNKEANWEKRIKQHKEQLELEAERTTNSKPRTKRKELRTVQ